MLLHELEHAYDAKQNGRSFFILMTKNKTNLYREDEYRDFWDESEYSVQINYEKPTAEFLGEGVRPKRFLSRKDCASIDTSSPVSCN